MDASPPGSIVSVTPDEMVGRTSLGNGIVELASSHGISRNGAAHGRRRPGEPGGAALLRGKALPEQTGYFWIISLYHFFKNMILVDF